MSMLVTGKLGLGKGNLIGLIKGSSAYLKLEAVNLQKSFEEELRYPETAIPLLVELASHDNPYVRNFVFSDPLTPLHVIDDFLGTKEWWMLSEYETSVNNIIETHFLNEDLMKKILIYSRVKLLETALQNEKFCEKYGDYIMKHKQKILKVIYSYAVHTSNFNHLEQLSQHPVSYVQHGVASNEKVSAELLYNMALKTQDSVVLYAIAAHPAADQKVFEHLITVDGSISAKTVIVNRNIPASILYELTQKSSETSLLSAIAAHPNVDQKVFEYLFTFNEPEIIDVLAGNPILISNFLHKIATSFVLTLDLATSIATNGQVSWETLDHVYKKFPTAKHVVIQYMQHEQTPPEVKVEAYYSRTKTKFEYFWENEFKQPGDWKQGLVIVLKQFYPKVDYTLPVEWLEGLIQTAYGDETSEFVG